MSVLATTLFALLPDLMRHNEDKVPFNEEGVQGFHLKNC